MIIRPHLVNLGRRVAILGPHLMIVGRRLAILGHTLAIPGDSLGDPWPLLLIIGSHLLIIGSHLVILGRRSAILGPGGKFPDHARRKVIIPRDQLKQFEAKCHYSSAPTQTKRHYSSETYANDDRNWRAPFFVILAHGPAGRAGLAGVSLTIIFRMSFAMMVGDDPNWMWDAFAPPIPGRAPGLHQNPT